MPATRSVPRFDEDGQTLSEGNGPETDYHPYLGKEGSTEYRAPTRQHHWAGECGMYHSRSPRQNW